LEIRHEKGYWKRGESKVIDLRGEGGAMGRCTPRLTLFDSHEAPHRMKKGGERGKVAWTTEKQTYCVGGGKGRK